MVKKLIPCLALICTLSLTTCLSAQDAAKQEKTETSQKAKKGQAKKKKGSQFEKRMLKEMKAVELTDDQKKKLTELVEAQTDTLNGLKTQADSIVSKENRKTLSEAIKQARADGKPGAEATKIGWEKIGLSADDQETLKGIDKQRNEIHAKIKSDLAATFTEEQKTAMASAKKAKGKNLSLIHI